MGAVAITFARGETASNKKQRIAVNIHSITHLLIYSFFHFLK